MCERKNSEIYKMKSIKLTLKHFWGMEYCWSMLTNDKRNVTFKVMDSAIK